MPLDNWNQVYIYLTPNLWFGNGYYILCRALNELPMLWKKLKHKKNVDLHVTNDTSECKNTLRKPSHAHC